MTFLTSYLRKWHLFISVSFQLHLHWPFWNSIFELQTFRRRNSGATRTTYWTIEPHLIFGNWKTQTVYLSDNILNTGHIRFWINLDFLSVELLYSMQYCLIMLYSLDPSFYRYTVADLLATRCPNSRRDKWAKTTRKWRTSGKYCYLPSWITSCSFQLYLETHCSTATLCVIMLTQHNNALILVFF